MTKLFVVALFLCFPHYFFNSLFVCLFVSCISDVMSFLYFLFVFFCLLAFIFNFFFTSCYCHISLLDDSAGLSVLQQNFFKICGT
jgi:hypothetical protein